jgi:hypothetical protein
MNRRKLIARPKRFFMGGVLLIAVFFGGMNTGCSSLSSTLIDTAISAGVSLLEALLTSSTTTTTTS